MLATGAGDGAVIVWDVKSLEPLFQHLRGRPHNAGGGHGRSASLTRTAATLATGGADGLRTKLWDLESHGELATLRGHSLPVGRACFSADGLTLATCGFAQDGRET